MIKIRKKTVALSLLLVAILLLLNACSKPECRNSADCVSKVCALAKCESKKCVYTQQGNCCGNGIKDAVEDGKTGNACTCPQDYGKCEGKGKVKIGSRIEDAAYVSYHCENNACVFGVERKDIVPQNFLDTIDSGYFKASSVEKYNKPFDAAKGLFDFKVSLDDAGKDIILPITLTKMKLLYSSDNSRAEQLVAEKDIDSALNAVGDEVAITAPLNLNYRPAELEESGSIRYSIDYTYAKRVISGRNPDGSNTYSTETARATFNSPTKPIILFRSE